MGIGDRDYMKQEPDEPGYVSPADAMKDTPETQSQADARAAANEPSKPEDLEKLFQTKNGSKFQSMQELLEYIFTLYDLEGNPSDKRSGDLKDTRFMRALYTFYTFLEKEHFFGVWPTGEIYPSGLSGSEFTNQDIKVKFDPKTNRPAFNPEFFEKLFDACEQFFTVAPGLSEANRNKYIKNTLYGIKRDAEKYGEEYGFNSIIKWLNNMYLAGRNESVNKGGIGLPRPYRESKTAVGLYLYESKHDAYASLLGTLNENTLAKIVDAHKRGVWLGLVEGYNHISPELDPRPDHEPTSGYDSIAPETTPPSAAPNSLETGNHMDCPSCGAHLEVSVEDLPTGPSPLDQSNSIAEVENFFSEPDECMEPTMESTGADFAPAQEISREAVMKSLKKKEGITGAKGAKLVGGDKKPAAPKK